MKGGRSRGRNRARAYLEELGLRAPSFLAFQACFLTALAFYRLRSGSVIGAFSTGLSSGEGLRSYLVAAAGSDALALGTVLLAVALAWLASPVLRGASAAAALLAASFASLFTALASDFLRVYQTAFSKSFVGGEHATGVRSMLMSAASELTPLVLAAAIALGCALAASLALSFRRKDGALARASFAAMRLSVVAAVLCLAGGAAASIAAAAERPKAGAAPASVPTAAASRAARDRARGVELGANPLSALLYGPRRETFTPALPAAPAFYDTDSLENPAAYRQAPDVKRGRYNVILYFFESTSWRYYDLERGGRPVLPAMRELARHGLLLRNHYSNYPLSANTLYSVLSSRYSMYGKAMIFHDYYDVDVRTLPEVLRDAGYATCFIHTGDLLYASRNKFLANRGIDRIVLGEELAKDPRYRESVGWGADERSMIDPAAAWIKEQARPFLLMMSPVSPHHPYAIPEGFPKLVDPDEPGIRAGERNFRNYLNSLHYADAALGLLVEALEREGLMENTVLVVVTDHGEAFYQHEGNYNHPLFVYEENVHVPALFYSRELFPEGSATESVTRHVDIMPSILDLLGIDDSARRDGESVFSRSREKMAVFHTSWTDEFMGVRDGRWKYIVRMKDSRAELYDLSVDPWEESDVSGGNPAIVERYRGVADSMAAYMIDQYRNVPRMRLAPRDLSRPSGALGAAGSVAP
jgi:arylsulfatase A-like enzyme